jgi:hypothetical protein
MPLWPGGEGTASLSDVTEAADVRHKHGINIYLVKERGRNGNSRWNTDLGCLAELTLVAGADVPLDILLEGGPP